MQEILRKKYLGRDQQYGVINNSEERELGRE